MYPPDHVSFGGLDGSRVATHLQDDLALQSQWYINGRHYSRTLVRPMLAGLAVHRLQDSNGRVPVPGCLDCVIACRQP